MNKKHSDSFKTKVTLEAIKGEKTLAEISSLYEVHVNVIAKWKKQALENFSAVFGNADLKQQKNDLKKNDELCKIIGQQKIEIEWLKKKLL